MCLEIVKVQHKIGHSMGARATIDILFNIGCSQRKVTAGFHNLWAQKVSFRTRGYGSIINPKPTRDQKCT